MKQLRNTTLPLGDVAFNQIAAWLVSSGDVVFNQSIAWLVPSGDVVFNQSAAWLVPWAWLPPAMV